MITDGCTVIWNQCGLCVRFHCPIGIVWFGRMYLLYSTLSSRLFKKNLAFFLCLLSGTLSPTTYCWIWTAISAWLTSAPASNSWRTGRWVFTTLLQMPPPVQSKHTRAFADLIVNPQGSPRRSVWFSGLAVPALYDSDNSLSKKREKTFPSGVM